jgi:ribosomal-protein-alanine N-acetyltransferase
MTQKDDVSESTLLSPMRDAHLAQIAEMHQQINPSPWTLEQWQTCCGNPLYLNWVIEEQEQEKENEREQIVAFACYICSGPEAELLNIGVTQNQQGKGLGEGLLRSSLLLLPETAEHCFLEVRRSNIPAINLYQKLQFESVAERKDYYRQSSGLIEDALIFRKNL